MPSALPFVSDRVKFATNVAGLASLNGLKDGDVVQTQGYYTPGDGGGNAYRYDSGSSATVDGGFVINGPGGTGRFLAVNQSIALAEQWGCYGDDSTDDHDALEAALLSGAPVHLSPGKVYRIASELDASDQAGDLALYGHGSSIRNTGSGGILTGHGVTRTTTTLSASASRGDTSITVASIGDFAIGDVVIGQWRR